MCFPPSLLLEDHPIHCEGRIRVSRTALVIAGHDQGNESRMTRGWKLVLLLPRVLLHRPARGRMVPRKKLEERVSCFQEDMWLRLLEESQSSEAQGRNQVDRLEKRANRVLSLVQIGEFVRSSGCSRGSRSRTRDVGNFEGVDKPRTPTSSATTRV